MNLRDFSIGTRLRIGFGGILLILVAMVQGVQMAGDRLVRSLAHRR